MLTPKCKLMRKLGWVFISMSYVTQNGLVRRERIDPAGWDASLLMSIFP